MLVDHVSCRVVTHQHDISIQIKEHQRRSLRAWHHVGRVPDTRPRAHLGSGSMARWARVQFQRESAQLKIQTWGTELRQMMHTDCCRHVVFWPWQKCIIIEDANLPCVWLKPPALQVFISNSFAVANLNSRRINLFSVSPVDDKRSCWALGKATFSGNNVGMSMTVIYEW